MKKTIFGIFVLLFSIPAFAQLEQGQQMISLRGGLGFQLQNSGITYSDTGSRVNWGSLGGEVGLSYYYLLSEKFGVGADISIGDFEGGDLTFRMADDVDDETHLLNLMLTGRYTTNPTKRVRFYFPFGAGLVVARQDLYINYYGTEYDKKKTDTSLGFFIGAGMEFDLGNSGWSLGLESRYNTFWYDTDKILRGAPASIHGDGNRRYEYLSFNLNVSKRF